VTRRPGRGWGRATALLLGCLGSAGCAAPPFDASARATVSDLDGRSQHPLQVAPGAVHVLVFLSQECPIANSYAPVLQQLARDHTGPAVRWFLVHVDPDLDVAAARAHASAYELPGTVVLDPHHQLATALGITCTPEAAVLGAAGLCYRGRIDDQWPALGSRRPATAPDLRAAIDRTRAGGEAPRPWPAAVGCRLPEPAPRPR
jgi:hypothetical protein